MTAARTQAFGFFTMRSKRCFMARAPPERVAALSMGRGALAGRRATRVRA